MQIPNADFLERAGSKAMGARLWRLPPMSANTLVELLKNRASEKSKEFSACSDNHFTIALHGSATFSD